MTIATPPIVDAIASIRQQFIDTYTREIATTLKVIRAFPPDQIGLTPHPRAKTAGNLAWMFTLEQGVTLAALTDKLELPGPPFPPAPGTWEEIVSAFEGGTTQLLGVLDGMSDAQLMENTQFFTGPGQIGSMPKINLAWFLLMDQIHHRGQLSVYLRICGAKVPSIYGPSADEPWF